MSSKCIKLLKTGEYKCELCNVRFVSKELAQNHLKTMKHLENKEAEQQSKIRLLESQNQQMDSEVLSQKLDLILHKLDLMAERTTRLEMRVERFETEFDRQVVRPQLQQQKLNRSIDQDPVLRQQLDEVRQIELAERLLKQKVEGIQSQRLGASQLGLQ